MHVVLLDSANVRYQMNTVCCYRNCRPVLCFEPDDFSGRTRSELTT